MYVCMFVCMYVCYWFSGLFSFFLTLIGLVWWVQRGVDPGGPKSEADRDTNAPPWLNHEVISCIYVLYFWSFSFKARDRFESHHVHHRNYACEPRLWRHNDVIIASSMTLPSPHITSHLLTNMYGEWLHILIYWRHCPAQTFLWLLLQFVF